MKRGRLNIEPVVFPEYSLNGASKAIDPELQCAIGGPQIGLLRDACRRDGVWA
ncbi:hypothetical protein [Paracoccus binzhouensis]|uniref:hypothetical protein n=1 Tax=Paracoccus binzhouensis TaxID=2796149 RepID=UPI001E2E275F|nr:hypothetical protein [Paracoccus binzhouensis]